jgi:hypothetical protein
MRDASNTGPTDMYGGIARLGQGVVSALMNRRADRGEQRGMDDANAQFDAVMQQYYGGAPRSSIQAGAAPAGGNFNAEVQPSEYEAQGIPDPRSPEFNVIDDTNLPVDPYYVHAPPQGAQPPQAQPPQAQPQGADMAQQAQQVGQLPMQEIIGLLNNPYLQPGQAQFLQMIVENKFMSGEWKSAGNGVIYRSDTGETMQVGQPDQPSLVQEFNTAKAQGFKASCSAKGDIKISGTISKQFATMLIEEIKKAIK